VGDFRYPRLGLEMLGVETSYMGQFLGNPPSVEGWNHGQEWIDSGALVKRINFAADAVSNISYPGVQALVNRVKAMGNLSPEASVDACLNIMGPLEVEPGTRHELVTKAEMSGELQWDAAGPDAESTQKVLDILALIAATREYQFC